MDAFNAAAGLGARDATPSTNSNLHLLGHSQSADDLYNAAACCDAEPAPRPLSYPAAPTPDTIMPARMTVQLLPSLPAAKGQQRPPERPVDRKALLECAPDREETLLGLRNIEDLRETLKIGPRWSKAEWDAYDAP